MSSYLAYCTFGALFTLLCIPKMASSGSCHGICCLGNNSSCHTVHSTNNMKCFCDEHCSRSGDCCPDYRDACHREIPLNCVLSNWKRWTACSNKCGTGVKRRSRKILIHPSNGGQKCSHLSESRSCQGSLCPAQSQTYRQKKTNVYSKGPLSVIQILPDLRSTPRIYKYYSHKYGIRRHIYLRTLRLNNMTESENKDTSYCNFYQITMTMGSCRSLQKLSTIERANWSKHAKYLKDASHVCVTCYLENQYDHLKNQCVGLGPPNRESRWRALRSDNCHGYFKLLKKVSKCRCQEPSFRMT